ncbi:MAG: helix-turn-helix domain-containing protein [Coriobacteriia bacterium]|nr:helix-turn-helix domain-containing protein [Coriobacteriia bacterium]
MASDTRERIIWAALDMISERGYDGTNLRDLAASLGLSKSALYRHFSSKEDIWNALTDSVEQRYAAGFAAATEGSAAPTSIKEMMQLSLRQIDYTINDPVIIKIRKVLTQEQFRSPRMAHLATKHFYTDLVSLNEGLFKRLMGAGIMRTDDPHLLAMEYVCPIAELVRTSDRQPELREECMTQIRAYAIRFFNSHAAT